MTDLTDLRVFFRGILTYVDEPSDDPPSGAEGHRVILTRAVAAEALLDLPGLPVFRAPYWNRHGSVRCGTITGAALIDSALHVWGEIDADRWPTSAPANDVLGMSYDMQNVHIEDLRADTWTMTRCHFTGANVLLKDRAAYKKTAFQLETYSLNIAAQARPIDPDKEHAQLHIKHLPIALRMELDVLSVKSGTPIKELVPELLKLGIAAWKQKKRVAKSGSKHKRAPGPDEDKQDVGRQGA